MVEDLCCTICACALGREFEQFNEFKEFKIGAFGTLGFFNAGGLYCMKTFANGSPSPKVSMSRLARTPHHPERTQTNEGKVSDDNSLLIACQADALAIGTVFLWMGSETNRFLVSRQFL